MAGFCLSLKPVVIEHRRSRNVALMDPWEGTPPTPTSKPLLGVHNLSSTSYELSSTSYELDGVSGTYGPSCVGRRVSRQQINQLPPTPRGATNWRPPLGRTMQKYHSGSISRALHCLENSMTLACVRRASFGAKRGATSRKLRPPGGRGFFIAAPARASFRVALRSQPIDAAASL